METKHLNTLIIDDHPLLIDAYKSALLEIELDRQEWKFNIREADSCDTALQFLERLNPEASLDLVFLDIKLPPASDGSHLSGEDLGLEIRAKSKMAKIVVATTFNDNYRIHNIFRSINPEGFIIKSDINAETLGAALIDVLTNPPYYSRTVIQAIRKYISHDFLLDKWDRFILYELSQGTKMKELPKLIPFSLGALEKRKSKLKTIFDIKHGEDRELLMRAREHGFI